MIPISNAYVGSTCELKDVDNKPLATGTIAKITNDYVEIKFDGVMKILSPNTLIKASIFNERLGFKVIIGKVYIGNMEFIRIVEVMSLVDFEKRDFFRITIGESTSFYSEAITPQELHYTKLTPYPAYLNNISLCGVYFKTPEHLDLGDKIYMVIDLARGADIFPCTIRRNCKEEDENGKPIYGYGCEFTNHTQRQSDYLYKYIFDKQLSFLKRKQDKDK